MTFPKDYIWLIPAFPLLGALINGLGVFSRVRFAKTVVSTVACTAMLMSFFMSVLAVCEVRRLGQFVNLVYPWIQVGKFSVDLAFLMDPLSSVMILVVTGVGTLIHFYSAGYMHEDESFQRYFAYLNLFVFFMLLLVLGENILVMFVGWEGVGLCSYLLIGFWFQHKPNAVAGMKAFVVNRIGDFAFIVGFCLLYWALSQHGVYTMSFPALREHAHLLTGMSTIFGLSIATVVTGLFFFGATGKSAQIPLYVWLPDAMAGPTPVSALIHAATMVTAGVYMIGRNSFLFTMAPATMMVVASVGVLTALFAGTIGLAQTDIKKVLAYSTVSQLGYMFLGMGVGAFSAGIMHLMTHAFFKGLLFLGAGSVIHAMHHEQDMRKMGALKDKIPWTYRTFMVGYIAIIGMPPLAGFVSKDEILWKTFQSGLYGKFLWFLGWIAAGITAFYMSRLVFMTFFGSSRVDHHTEKHMHESPKIMIIPLGILAVLSIVGGFIGWPHALGGHNFFEHWLAPVFAGGAHDAHVVAAEGHHSSFEIFLEYALMVASVGLAGLAAWLAWQFYGKPSTKPSEIAARRPKLYQAILNKYYVDEFYQATVVRGTIVLTKMLAWLDDHIVDAMVNVTGKMSVQLSKVTGESDNFIVDGLVNMVGRIASHTGNLLRQVQTGRIQNYVYVAVASVAFVIIIRLMM